MNRSQKRAYAKKINTPQKLEQFSFKVNKELKEKYEDIYEKKYKEELGQSIDYFILAIVYTLHFNEQTNFNNDVIQDFMQDLLVTVDNFRTGEYSPMDYKKQLDDEGIKIINHNGKEE